MMLTYPTSAGADVRALIQRLLAEATTFASFVALVVSLKQNGKSFSGWQISLMTVAVAAFLVTAALEIGEYRGRQPRRMKDDQTIRDYMHQWIRGGGKVVVFSRTLSWVSDDEMAQMMDAKARAGDLTLVMPGAVDKSRRLESAGAKVIYYGENGYTVRSRFTLTNEGRADTAVAVGRQGKDGVHMVSEYRGCDEDPAFWLAQDLAEILSRLDETKAGTAG